MRFTRATAVVPMTLACLGCGAAAAPAGNAPTASPTPRLAAADLKYRLIAGLGHVSFCDPDLYPLGRVLTDAQVQARLSSAQSQDPATYAVVLRHLGLSAAGLTPSDRRAIYRELKELQALPLTLSGDVYRFSYTVTTQPGRGGGGTRVDGTIDGSGHIRVTNRAQSMVMCPL